jgi:hypothetical protein
MVKVFISYSRVDREFVKSFVANLSRKYGHDNIWYDDNIPGGHKWWQFILQKIAWSDIFIYLLSNDSVTSEYCQAEFKEAQRLQKHIVTVQIRDRTKLDETLGDIQYINMIAGVDMGDAYTRLYAAIDMYRIPKQIPKPLWTPETGKPGSVAESEPHERADITTPTLKSALPETMVISSDRDESNAIIKAAYITGIFVIAAAFIGLLGVIIAPTLNQSGITPTTTDTQTIMPQASLSTETPATPTAITETPSATPSPTVTLSEVEVEETIRAEMVAIQTEERLNQIGTETKVSIATQLANDVTATVFAVTAESWTNTPTPNLRATAEARLTLDAQSIISATNTTTHTALILGDGFSNEAFTMALDAGYMTYDLTGDNREASLSTIAAVDAELGTRLTGESAHDYAAWQAAGEYVLVNQQTLPAGVDSVSDVANVAFRSATSSEVVTFGENEVARGWFGDDEVRYIVVDGGSMWVITFHSANAAANLEAFDAAVATFNAPEPPAEE